MQPWHARVVAYAHWNRFVTASMLQRVFRYRLRSERTAQRHLAALVGEGYLATAQPWAVGRNFPYVYYATPLGLKFVKSELGEQVGIDSSPAEEKRTRGYGLHSLLHELFLSEFTLALTRTVGERDDLQLLELERRYFRAEKRLQYWDGGERKIVEPDLGFLLTREVENGSFRSLPMHFVEMENGTHSMQGIGEKLVAYEQWSVRQGEDDLASVHERHEIDAVKPEFRMLVICHDKYGTAGDERVLVDWMVQALRFSRAMRKRIWLCTVSDLKHGSRLDVPLWYRVQDARRWLGEYRRHFGESEQTTTNFVRHRRFVTERLMDMPRHALLP